MQTGSMSGMPRRWGNHIFLVVENSFYLQIASRNTLCYLKKGHFPQVFTLDMTQNYERANSAPAKEFSLIQAETRFTSETLPSAR